MRHVYRDPLWAEHVNLIIYLGGDIFMEDNVNCTLSSIGLQLESGWGKMLALEIQGGECLPGGCCPLTRLMQPC